MRLPIRYAARAVVSAAVLALLVSGCGGSSATTAPSASTVRQAAGVDFAPDSQTCPEKSPSYTYKTSIVNRMPFPIRLTAGEYTCNDWSGVSTPGHAFTGKVLQPGESLAFTLEPRKYTTRAWTLAFSEVDAGLAPFGAVRLRMPQTTLDLDRIEVPGGTEVTTNAIGAKSCWIETMGRTEVPATPTSDYPGLFFEDGPTLGVISYNGRVAFIGHCGVTSGGG